MWKIEIKARKIKRPVQISTGNKNVGIGVMKRCYLKTWKIWRNQTAPKRRRK